MAISFRYFVVDGDEGRLRHIPHRVNEGLHFGTDAIPEFAGSKQRIIEVVLENERGKPVRILDARGRYWFFDDDGNLDRSEAFSFMRWMDFGDREEPKGKVIDLRPGIERKRWKQRHFWDVTAADLDHVTAAIWPFVEDGPDSSVKAVKGKAQKVPPLTSAGEEAMGKIQSKISGISYALEGLSEPALKGLAYALRRNAQVYDGEKVLYEATAAEVDRQREIRSRYRTGKGAWYADLQVWRWNEGRTQQREINNIEERHESKAAAIEAARRLLAENAHLYEINISLEARVISELEWVPMKRDTSDDDDEDRIL